MSVKFVLKVITLSLLFLGQDKQESGIDHMYSESGDDETVQFSITCSLIFILTVWFCSNNNLGGPTKVYGICINMYTHKNYVAICKNQLTHDI